MRWPAILRSAPHSHDPLELKKTYVLLVDDEPALRTLLADSLAMEGCNVMEASNGEEAVNAANVAERIDVVVTDIRMPHMDGITMANALRTARPDLPFVFVTGYQTDPGALGPNSRLLFKPFLPTALMKAMHELTASA
jgi:CheY-like chemotaxis protein